MASADITDIVEQDLEPTNDQEFQNLLETKVSNAFSQANSSRSIILNVEHHTFSTAEACLQVLQSLQGEEKTSFEEALLRSAETSLS